MNSKIITEVAFSFSRENGLADHGFIAEGRPDVLGAVCAVIDIFTTISGRLFRLWQRGELGRVWHAGDMSAFDEVPVV